MKKGNVLEIKDLSVDFMTVRGIVYAVQGVDLEVKQGEIHGIVGESGCGKSVTSKSVIRLHNKETTRYAGDIYIRDDSGEKDVLAMNKKQLRDFRGSTAAMIFQDPMTSLDPIMKAGEQIAEMLRAKKNLNRREAREKVIEMFEKIGITPAEKRYEQYPFEMSGGMLQRIMIAMAIICEPKLLIADEPTTALDVTIQAQILKLIKKLQQESGTSVIFITHNLGVVAEICDSVTVMYAGKAVETASVVDIFDHPAHPYTQALISAKPKEHPLENKKHILLEGDIPNAVDIPEGCRFAGRCRYFKEGLCDNRTPKLKDIGNGHYVACHFPLGIDLSKTAADM